MRSKNSIVDHSSKGEVIKETSHMGPDQWRSVNPQALVIKPVDLCDLSALMVSSRKSNSVWVAHFQSHQQQDAIQGIMTAIYIVAEEEVALEWRFPPYQKQLQQIIKFTILQYKLV